MSILSWVWIAISTTACLFLWRRKRHNLWELGLWLPRLKQAPPSCLGFLLQESWLILAILCFGRAFWLESAKPLTTAPLGREPVLAWVTWVPLGEISSPAGLQQQSLILGLNREFESRADRPLVGVYSCGSLSGPFCPLTSDYSFVTWMLAERKPPLRRPAETLRGELLAIRSLSESASSQKHVFFVFPDAQMARMHIAELSELRSMSAALPQLILLKDAVVPEDLQSEFRGKAHAMGGKVIPDGMVGQYLELHQLLTGWKIASGAGLSLGSWWVAAGVCLMGLSCLAHGKSPWKSKNPTVEAD